MNSEEPLVSILVNCYNSEKYLKECLDSIFAQTYTNFEIILWDNCSVDLTAKIAKSYDDRLRYFKGNTNVPLGEARNLALDKTQGELIGFLDSDDKWEPTKLEKQVPLFNNPKVGLVFCDTINFDHEGDQKRVFKTTNYYTGMCFEKLLTNYFLSIGSVIIRKKCLHNQTEYFDPKYQMIEEADLFRRIAFEWELDMVDEPLNRWRVHSSSLTFSQPKNFSDETRDSIEKYKKLWPDFEEKFSHEIWSLHREANLNDAKIQWAKGNGSEARILLKPYISSYRIFLYFIFTMFPKKMIDRLLFLFGKGVRL